MRSNSIGCRRPPAHFLQQKSGLAPTRMCDRLRTKIQYSGRELQKQGNDGNLQFTLKPMPGINQANTEQVPGDRTAACQYRKLIYRASCGQSALVRSPP